ncbi:MAG: sugar transferase, partial [Coriobacteriales bacterium]
DNLTVHIEASATPVDANSVSPVDNPIVSLDETSRQIARPRRAYRAVKRVIDVLLSIVVLVVAIIPLSVLSLIIIVQSHGSPFYISRRVGKNGRPIKVYKLRTMVVDSDDFEKYLTPEQIAEWHKEHKIDADPRVIPIGRFLRSCSLDELPQFFNVLLGQMSIVGPRPITKEEFDWFSEDERKALLSVLPGITGLWQVSGRSDVTFQSGERQRIEL